MTQAVPALAGNDNYPLGARSAGMATASVTLTDIWASANNQAGLAWTERVAAALYYENRWNVRHLGLQAAAVAVPVRSTVIGLACRYFGYPNYNETKIGLAVAKKLWDKLALGIQVDYFHNRFPDDYGTFDLLCGEVGLLYKPLESLTVGVHLFNATHSKQKANPDEHIPMIMRFGLSYSAGERALIAAETEKDLDRPAIFKLGMEFMPVKNFFLRGGLSTGLMYRYTFGLGYRWKMFQADFAFSKHQLLGYSPHISLRASF